MHLDDLRSLLSQFFSRAREEKQEQHIRTLPFGDYIVDRWEKARQLGFGEGSSVYDNVVILGEPSVGKNVWIGPNVVLDASGGLTIGDNCNISAGVQIYSHDSVDRCISGGTKDISKSPVVIGASSYVGPNSVIAKGVRIGSGCVIGAMSLVLKDVPDGSIAYGTPAQSKQKDEKSLNP
ncbi:MAG: acyltransferase [Rhodobacteraceae bacterium]|nr:acyltransferase [Paracoccaceae bacterium]